MSKLFNPICINCNLEMKALYKGGKNGVTVVMMAYNPPEPYKAYRGDLVVCPGCGRKTVDSGGLANNGNSVWEIGDDNPPNMEDEWTFPVYETVKRAKECKPKTYQYLVMWRSDGQLMSEKIGVADSERERELLIQNHILELRKKSFFTMVLGESSEPDDGCYTQRVDEDPSTGTQNYNGTFEIYRVEGEFNS